MAQQRVETLSEDLGRKTATLNSLARSLATALGDAKSADGLKSSSSGPLGTRPRAKVRPKTYARNQHASHEESNDSHNRLYQEE